MAVSLDKTDATLNLSLAEDLLTATPLVTGSLSQLWSGVRANSCVSSGKVFFVVNLVNELSGDCEGVRPEALIGVSARATAVSQLGCGSSWAYASTGQKWTASKAESFGPTYSAGDRIGCFLDMNSEPCTVSFSHNEQWLGHAYELQQSDHSHKALYPHIMLKSLAVQLDFNGNGLVAGERWPKQAADYISWQVSRHQQPEMLFFSNSATFCRRLKLCCVYRLLSKQMVYQLPALCRTPPQLTVKSWSWLACQVIWVQHNSSSAPSQQMITAHSV